MILDGSVFIVHVRGERDETPTHQQSYEFPPQHSKQVLPFLRLLRVLRLLKLFQVCAGPHRELTINPAMRVQLTLKGRLRVGNLVLGKAAGQQPTVLKGCIYL